MAEPHTIETYGLAPHNRNIWQTGRRHVWPILLSVLVPAVYPLLATIASQMRARPIRHGMSVRPSGLFPSVLYLGPWIPSSLVYRREQTSTDQLVKIRVSRRSTRTQ